MKRIVLPASLMAAVLVACVERHYDGAMNVHFRGHVSTASGMLTNASVYLKDRRLREPSMVFICRTNANGACAGTAVYDFSYDERRWPWENASKAGRRMSDRFALVVTADGYESATETLDLSQDQVEGVTPVDFSIKLRSH
jgi:hypothetical protein